MIFIILLVTRIIIGQPLLGVIDVGVNQAYFALIGPFVMMGDLFGSKVKRTFYIKDSCDYASLRFALFKQIKAFLGDHGGCFDRIDSIVSTGTILLILGWIYMLIF